MSIAGFHAATLASATERSPATKATSAATLPQHTSPAPAANPQVAAAPSELEAQIDAGAAASAPAPAPAAHAQSASVTGQQLRAPAGPTSAPAPTAAPAQPSVAPAPPAPAPQPPQPAPQPYQLYDSVSPGSIPSSSQAVAVYADGNYQASPAQVGQRGLTLWIDTNGSDTHADVLDVEPGDATPAQAATWVAQKLDGSPNSTAIIYTMRSDWGAVQQAVSQLAWWMPSHTKYWIADPTGVPHIVPGSDATQWYWGQNYDISTALPSFN
jgi:hypothetical protein